MTATLPGLLQPWGIALFAAIAIIAYAVAYLWHRADRHRPAIHLDVLALAFLALMTGGFFWRVLTESGIMMPTGGGDIAALYFPTYSYAAAEIKAGSLPLWNPHIFSGMPLAADVQSGLFYPVNWILFLFVKIEYGALEWLLIFHYWLASAFTYLFLRDLKLGRPAALVGGIVFGFCGFMTAHFGHLPMILVASWIPATLLAFRRAYFAPSFGGWVWSIVAGVCIAMSFLAGHAQVFSYGLMAAGLLWLYLLFSAKPLTLRGALPWVAKGATAIVVFAGLCALQLLPSVELSAQSVRSSISYEEAGAFAAQPITLLNLFLPRVYGSNPSNYSPSDWQSTENWAYCGVVALALAAAGLLMRKNRMVGFFAILSALALLIMVGDLTILGAWFYKFLPGFSSLRSTGRALIMLGLGLSGLAAYGMDGLVASLQGQGRERRHAFGWLIGLSAAVGIAFFFVMPLFFSNLLQLNGAQYSRLPFAVNDLGMLIIWLGLLAAIGWAAYRGRITVPVASGAIVMLVVFDLFSPNSQFNPTTTDLLSGYKNFSAYSLVYKFSRDPVTEIPLRVDSDADAQDVWQPNTAMLVSADSDTKLYDTGGAFNPLKLRRYDYLWDTAKHSPDSPLYDLTGARYRVLAPSTVMTNTAKWRLAEKYTGFNIYENQNAIPRLYLVHDARIIPEGFNTVEAVRRFNVDPKHSVILESGTAVESTLPGTAENPQTPSGSPPSGESVVASRYSAQEVVIDVNATAPGWVVLTDAWYPGWEATIDGRSVPLEIAYHAYRAVRVDAGAHTITMQFRPVSWTWGSLISLLSLLAVLAALAILVILPWSAMRRETRTRRTS
ncbi:MAG: YfhO family protein [Chloroflexota bacterium]